MRPGFWVDLIMTSDWHLSHRPPIARARSDVDWYSVMYEYLKQLRQISTLLGAPIVAAGDIINHWTEPAELINFAIENMPTVYAVPGQHDLPNHSYQDIHRSPYWTLVAADKIHNLEYGIPHYVNTREHQNGMALHGFPWGTEPLRLKSLFSKQTTFRQIHVAVAHRYIWQGKHQHEGAQKIYESKSYLPGLDGYIAAAFGDNHKGFLTKVGKCQVMNCGTLIRRSVDEIEYKPQIGLLWNDGKITSLLLDTSNDKFMIGDPEWKAFGGALSPTETRHLKSFLEAASRLVDTNVSWDGAIQDWLKFTSQGDAVKQAIRSIAGL